MAIAYDTSSSSQTGSATTLTYAHTCSGSDRVLTVIAVANRTITGITYNGVTMTLGVSLTFGSNSNNRIYYLIAPASGTNNIVVTISSVGPIQSGGLSFTGADSIGASASNESATTSVSQSITTTKDNSFVVCGEGSQGGTGLTFTQNSGQTEVFEENDSTSSAAAGAYKQIVTAGSNSFQYTLNVTSRVPKILLLEIQEKTTSNSNFLMFM